MSMASDMQGTIFCWCKDTENENGLVTLPVEKCFSYKIH